MIFPKARQSGCPDEAVGRGREKQAVGCGALASSGTAKTLQKQIQEMGYKVRAQIQGEALRVVGAKLDELQAVQAGIRAKPPEVPVQFNNYK